MITLHLQPQYKFELFHIYFTSLHCTGKYELNKLTSLPMCGFIAQLVERLENLLWWSLFTFNVVLIPQNAGENIRANKDLTHANKYIKRTRHAIPTLRELETRLNGTKYFSHLVVNDGYMQLELAGESRNPTAFLHALKDCISGSTARQRSLMRRFTRLVHDGRYGCRPMQDQVEWQSPWSSITPMPSDGD